MALFMQPPGSATDLDAVALNTFIAAEGIAMAPSDFTLGSEIARGGYGVVFNATRLSDGMKVAIKFFGYTDKRPEWQWLRKEIEFLNALRPINSVASMCGILYDTENGLRGGKRHRKVYPAIVMEKLEGKDLCDRVVLLMQAGHRGFTEGIASTIFQNFLLALKDVHEKAHMINCDLKTENMVFVGAKEDDYRVKIIDFGTALHVDATTGATTSETLRGTVGFMAPETLRSPPGRFVYTTQSDVFQAGCILFVILHANLPFGNTQQSTVNIRGPYPTRSLLPLNANLSDDCKDLILSMLDKDPTKRITIQQALQHPWIVNQSQNARTNVDLGPEYRSRIKSWAYRKKLKQVLKDRMFTSHEQKEKIVHAVLLHSMAGGAGGAGDQPATQSISNAKFKALQSEFMQITEPKASREVSRVEFFAVATASGVDWLANPQIFDIFDDNMNGQVDYFEFLISLTPFRTEYDPNDLARFYFEVFDLDGNGAIDKDEFEWALKMFLMDTDAALAGPVPHHSAAGSSSSSPHFTHNATATSAVTSASPSPARMDSNASSSAGEGSSVASVAASEASSDIDFITEASSFDEIFNAIDANGDGSISLQEFSNFFRVVNTSRSTFG